MNKELRTTVTAFIFHDNKLLLIQHKRTNQWLHVGGHAEENETLDEALEREVKEEVNLEIEFLENYNHFTNLPKEGFKTLPCPFYIHVRDHGDHRKMSFDFLCITKDISNLRIQEEEIGGYQWFSKKEIETAHIMEPLRVLSLKAFAVYEESLSQNQP